MLFSKINDSKNRERFHKIEKQKLISKFLFTFFINKPAFSDLESYRKSSILNYLTKNSQSTFSKTKIVRRCLINNRGRSSNRSFGLSRILFRNLLQFGIVPGYSKSVW
jgi:ribosomal protein S14